MAGMKLWVVVEHTNPAGNWPAVAFCGVFDSIVAAEARCRNSFFFVGPTELNQQIPEEAEVWPGYYYPRIDQRDEDMARLKAKEAG